MSRRAWIALGFAGVAGLALVCVASVLAFRWVGDQLEDGPDPAVAGFEKGFRSACLEQCEAAGDASGCEAYCKCRYQKMRKDRSRQEFLTWVHQQMEDAGPSGELVALGDRADLQCGGRLLESGFLDQCTRTCVDDGREEGACADYCECTFQYLRRGMDEEEADRWWLEHIAREEFTPEGQRAFQAAVDHCVMETLADEAPPVD